MQNYSLDPGGEIEILENGQILYDAKKINLMSWLRAVVQQSLLLTQ